MDIQNRTILIVGLGLIGGSVARALKIANPDQIVLASDSYQESLRDAIEDGVIDESGALAEVCGRADLVVLAVPPLIATALLPEIAASVRPGTVVTDVGSVKSRIVECANTLDAVFQSHFIPGHPIAGSEKSGYGASRADLFQNRNVILTPRPGNTPSALAMVNSLWRLTGAHVLGMSLANHDRVLAATSHLPHLLAFAIVDVLVKQEQSEDIFRYAAGGFADFSRLASSDAKMWSDIFVANASATAVVLDDYIEDLQLLKAAIVAQDHARLMQLCSGAKKARDNFVNKYFSGKTQTIMTKEILDFHVQPGGHIGGSLRVPGDKSISHRAIIFGSIAQGVTHVKGFLEGEDALNTLAAFRELGVTIVGPEKGELTIYGVGMHGLQPPRRALDMGNSGTAMRLMAGLLAAQPFACELSGDESLNQRPMRRISDPLQRMGARIETTGSGTPPLKIQGGPLKGIDYQLPMASAQVKSCVLLAGIYAEGETRVTEPAPCRDHTERMLSGFSYPISVEAGGRVCRLQGGQELRACDIDVPADISSAAFFLVAAAIVPGAELHLQHVGVNPTRTGVITILRAMGANISLTNEQLAGGEPVADITVRGGALKGIVIPEDQIPLAIDEFPALFIAAACASGETILHGAEELRVKESDRIAAMAEGLQQLGVVTETYPDGIRIVGGQLGGGTVESRGDHRIAMAFAIAALRAKAPIVIRDCANVATSFPGFLELARQAGLGISASQRQD